jgi:hypothetical protein
VKKFPLIQSDMPSQLIGSKPCFLAGQTIYVDAGQSLSEGRSRARSDSRLFRSRRRSRLVLIIFSMVVIIRSTVCFAGEFEDGLAAYERDDYKTALAVWMKAANKGNGAEKGAGAEKGSAEKGAGRGGRQGSPISRQVARGKDFPVK